MCVDFSRIIVGNNIIRNFGTYRVGKQKLPRKQKFYLSIENDMNYTLMEIERSRFCRVSVMKECDTMCFSQ